LQDHLFYASFLQVFHTKQKKKGGISMSIAKVIEISCQSEESFEDAIRQGIQGAAKSVRNIKSAWVKEQQVVVEDDRVVKYRVDLKVSFVIA
jgi:dodecin